ncbi:hypothetical protein KY336_00820 [Candidatus Woesearchaeota archaeon]|nr:hypothetical protein [Candidatus Woesearchaeota archaeon]
MKTISILISIIIGLIILAIVLYIFLPKLLEADQSSEELFKKTLEKQTMGVNNYDIPVFELPKDLNSRNAKIPILIENNEVLL